MEPHPICHATVVCAMWGKENQKREKKWYRPSLRENTFLVFDASNAPIWEFGFGSEWNNFITFKTLYEMRISNQRYHEEDGSFSSLEIEIEVAG